MAGAVMERTGAIQGLGEEGRGHRGHERKSPRRRRRDLLLLLRLRLRLHLVAVRRPRAGGQEEGQGPSGSS